MALTFKSIGNKIGKAAKKLSKNVLKVAPAVTQFIPGVGPIISKGLSLATTAQRLSSAISSPPTSPPITMQPFDPVNLGPPPIPYDTVRALVIEAYRRGQADALRARL